MRVALINPRLFNNIYNSFPVGLGYIAGALEKAGIEFAWYDQRLEDWTTEQLVEQIAQGPACDCFGVTGLITSYQFVKEVCHALRKRFPHTPIVLGGKQSGISAEILFREVRPDYCIHGEGEEAFVALLGHLADGHRPSTDECHQIPGLIYRDDEGRLQSNGYARIHDINDYRLPLRKLPMDRYVAHNSVQSNGLKSINLVSGRGCPFECSFCNFSDGISGKPVRQYKVEHIAEDLAYLKEHFGLQHVFYADDVFALSTKRLTAMGEMNHRLGLRYSTSMRLDMIDAEKVALFENTGCQVLMVGVESVSPRVLKYIDKRLDAEVLRANVPLLQNSKLVVSFNFISGYIGENAESLKETYDFCIQNRVLYTAYFATAFPNTRLYAMVQEKFGIPDEGAYLETLSGADLQTDYILNMSDLPEPELRRIRDRMIVGTALNCMTRSRLAQTLLRPAFSMYWRIIKTNRNRIAVLRQITDLVNWVVIKPLFRLSRRINAGRSTSAPATAGC